MQQTDPAKEKSTGWMQASRAGEAAYQGDCLTESGRGCAPIQKSVCSQNVYWATNQSKGTRAQWQNLCIKGEGRASGW